MNTITGRPDWIYRGITFTPVPRYADIVACGVCGDWLDVGAELRIHAADHAALAVSAWRPPA